MKRLKRLVACVLMTGLLFGTMVAGNYVLRQDAGMPEKKRNTPTEEQLKDWAAPDQEALDFFELGAFETDLPVVYLNTKGQQIQKENTIIGSIAILNANGEEQSVFTEPNIISDASIKYRGASSYSKFAKKQYRIKFLKGNSQKARDISLAGMGAHSEWVLHGPYLDKTLVRNKLMYDLARDLGDWAPDSRFVELFEDGVYRGVYLAVEPVTNGEARLRLSEFGLLSGHTAYITYRDRIGSGNVALNTYGKQYGYSHNELYLSYPSEKDLTKSRLRFVEGDISAFEEALYGANFADPDLGYAAYIDVDNWVDYFLLNEISMNYDAGNLSTYAYKELTGKLRLAIWDFNNAFDNYQWNNLDETGFHTIHNGWIGRLCQDRGFIDKVVSRYHSLRSSTFSDESLYRHMDAYQAELGAAIDRNFAVWGHSFQENLLIGTHSDGTSRDIGSYEKAVSQLKSMIDQRLAFLDQNIEKLYENCIN